MAGSRRYDEERKCLNGSVGMFDGVESDRSVRALGIDHGFLTGWVGV